MPVIAVTLGWQVAFLCTGVLSAAWLIAWLITYRTPDQQPKLSAAERAYIGHEPLASTRVPWLSLLRHRQAWAFIAAKFITDPVWWFFLSWLPKFLHTRHGLSLLALGLPLIVIYLAADFGSIGGGWLAGRFIKRGWSVNRARKTAMLVCALAVVPVLFAAKVDNVWAAVAVIGLAAAGAPGLVCQCVHADLRPVPSRGSGIGGGHRRIRRCSRRHNDLLCRLAAAGQRQLHAHVRCGRFRLPARPAGGAPAGAAHAAGAAGASGLDLPLQ